MEHNDAGVVGSVCGGVGGAAGASGLVPSRLTNPLMVSSGCLLPLAVRFGWDWVGDLGSVLGSTLGCEPRAALGAALGFGLAS